MPFGPLEIGIVLLIVLVIFGPKRLPDLGRNLGRGIRDFKSGITGEDDDPTTSAPAQATRVAETPQPTAEDLIAEAATPETVAEELEDARRRTPTEA